MPHSSWSLTWGFSRASSSIFCHISSRSFILNLPLEREREREGARASVNSWGKHSFHSQDDKSKRQQKSAGKGKSCSVIQRPLILPKSTGEMRQGEGTLQLAEGRQACSSLTSEHRVATVGCTGTFALASCCQEKSRVWISNTFSWCPPDAEGQTIISNRTGVPLPTVLLSLAVTHQRAAPTA